MTPLHSLDRSGQLAAYQRIVNSKKKYIICRLPCGIGKTAIAAQLACDGHKTLAVVATKSLQQQYRKYSFYDLYGKSNYECKEVGQQLSLLQQRTADLCECPKESKGACNIVCDYPRNRAEFIQAEAGIINYAKFLSDRSVVNSTDYVSGFDPEYLVLDEAHELSDLVVKTCGFSHSWQNKRLMKNCSPIEIDIEKVDYPQPVAKRMVNEIAMDWLAGLEWTLKQNAPKRPSENIVEWRWYKRMIDNVEVTLEAVKWGENDWHIYADQKGITIKPLTSRYHFQPLFNRADKVVLMSGTIQMSDVLSLGLRLEDVDFISMPSPFKPQDQPVYDLGGPRVTRGMTRSGQAAHVKILSKVFQDAPDHWTGLVHFPSKEKSWDYAEMLERETGRPIWTPVDGMETDEAMDDWNSFKRDGAVAVAWQFMTGVDMPDVNINLCGCVPYPNFGDKYERERFDHNPRQALVRVASKIEQQMARNRRGVQEHYGPNADKFCGLADAKWLKLRNLMDGDFRKSIV